MAHHLARCSCRLSRCTLFRSHSGGCSRLCHRNRLNLPQNRSAASTHFVKQRHSQNHRHPRRRSKWAAHHLARCSCRPSRCRLFRSRSGGCSGLCRRNRLNLKQNRSVACTKFVKQRHFQSHRHRHRQTTGPASRIRQFARRSRRPSRCRFRWRSGGCLRSRRCNPLNLKQNRSEPSTHFVKQQHPQNHHRPRRRRTWGKLAVYTSNYPKLNCACWCFRGQSVSGTRC